MHVSSLKLSLPAYLALEAAEAEHRHEFWDGECWAMTGTTPEHNDLAFAFESRLRPLLKDGPCRVYRENIRTRIADHKYVYPDLVVACPPEFDRTSNPPTLQNPKIIVEILSASTADFDRGAKLRAYYALSSVEEVILADQREADIQHHLRQPDGSWLVRLLGRGATLDSKALGVRLEVDALYEELSSQP